MSQYRHCLASANNVSYRNRIHKHCVKCCYYFIFVSGQVCSFEELKNNIRCQETAFAMPVCPEILRSISIKMKEFRYLWAIVPTHHIDKKEWGLLVRLQLARVCLLVSIMDLTAACVTYVKLILYIKCSWFAIMCV